MARRNFCNGCASALTWYAIDYIHLFFLPHRPSLGMNCRVGRFLPSVPGKKKPALSPAPV
jgi:hypothetical protein